MHLDCCRWSTKESLAVRIPLWHVIGSTHTTPRLFAAPPAACADSCFLTHAIQMPTCEGQGRTRYGASTYRSGSTLSSKEALWATRLCLPGRGDNNHIQTSTHPECFSKEITSAGEKRSRFLSQYASWADGQGSREAGSALELDIRSVGWAPYRDALTYRTHPKYTDVNYSEAPMASARALAQRFKKKRAGVKKAWDSGFIVNPQKKGFIDTSLAGRELARELQRTQQEERARGLSSWTGPTVSQARPSSGSDFVF